MDVVFMVRLADSVLMTSGERGSGQDEEGRGWETVVCVTGGDSALGGWDVKSSIPLRRSPE